MTRLGRYSLYQVPGVIVVAVAAWGLWSRFDVSPGLAWGALLVWIIKDIALYPMLKTAYDTADTADPARLIGREALVTRSLDPDGFVRLGGETWRARTDSSLGVIGPGRRVRIEAVDGLTLRVLPSDTPGGA